MVIAKDNLSPPHSLEAEKAVLGAIFREPEEKILEILGRTNLKPEHFYVDLQIGRAHV